MSDQAWPRDRSTDPARPTATGAAAGFILFAVIMLLMAGAGWALFSGRTWGRIVGISPSPPPTTRP